MKSKKKWVKVIPFAVLSMSAFIGAAACGKTENPIIPQDGPEIGEYYYDYSDNVEYSVNLGSGNTVSVNIDGIQGSGIYTLVDGAMTFEFKDGSSIQMSASWANDVLTLYYGDMTFTFLRKVDYTVTFNTDGGSHLENATVRNGRKLSQPATPTRTGYHFIGWCLAGSDAPFVFGQPVTGNMTLVAQWELAIPEDEEVTISFDLGYDAELAAMRTVNRRAEGFISPERSGYTFVGWWVSQFEDRNKLTYKAEEGMEFYADTTFFAVWQKDGESAEPSLSVDSTGVRWSKLAQSGTLKITAKDSDSGFTAIEKAIGATADTFESVDFANAPAGEYTVELIVGGVTVTRSYNNKALDRVYKYSFENGNILRFNSVRGENINYIIKVDCGDDNHDVVHDEYNNGNSTTFDFSNCEMQEGGIIFTVTARAEGFADSLPLTFKFDNLLGKISNYELDEETDTLDWDGVDGATNYVVTVKVGGEVAVDGLDIGNKTSFSLKEFTGEIEVSVYAKATGCNSPAATVFTFNKDKLATPANLRIVGDVLSWDGDAEAAYKVFIGDKTFDVTGTEVDLTTLAVDWTEGNDYGISVQAVGDKSSLLSDEFDARYYAMGQTLTYKRNAVSWQAVIGAQSYDIMVNGDAENIISVTDGATSAAISLTAAGDNTVSVRFNDGTKDSEWVDVTVFAYEVSLKVGNINNPDEVKLYYAAGDKVTLPEDYTYAGYNFGGWYDVENGGAVMGRKFIDEYFTANSDIELFGFWNCKTYDVGLNFGEYGTVSGQTAPITYSKNFNLPVPQVTDGRMVFRGWSANKYGTNMLTDAKGNSLSPWIITVENYTLYAIYSNGCTFGYSVLKGKKGYTVTKGSDIGDIKELYIPDTYDDGVNGELPVIYIPDGAFENCTTIKTVSIPESVVSIDGTAFSGCSKIESYEVRSSGATDVRYKTLGGTLVEVGRTGTIDIKAIPGVIPNGEYTVPNGVTKLPISSFRNVYGLNKVSVPASVEVVEQAAFDSCSNLHTITFLDAENGEEPKPLSIDIEFIKSCTSVRELNFPRHLSVFDERSVSLSTVFAKQTRLEKINVSEGDDYFSIDGILCQKVKQGNESIECIKYCPMKFLPQDGSKNYVIPTRIQKIAPYAFAGAVVKAGTLPSDTNVNQLESIVFHSGIMEVGERAFYGNRKLKSVTFKADKSAYAKTIGYQAFYYCDRLETLDFQETGELKQRENGEGQTEWYFDAVDKCNITSIGEEAFYKLKITSLVLPSTLTKIEANAFSSNDKLANLDLSHISTNLVFGNTVFNGCIGLSEVDITQNVGFVEFGSIFYNCANLKGLNVDPNSPFYSSDEYGVLYNKDKTAISYCPDGFTGLNGEYAIPDTVETVASGIFSGKKGLKRLIIPASVKSIGAHAFENCSSLNYLEIAGGEIPLAISDSAFSGCTALREVNLPERTKSIGDRAFYGLALNSITLNVGLETIGNEAFSKSTIQVIEIPYTVTAIGSNAFYECTALWNVTFAGTPQGVAATDLTVGELAFYSTAVVNVDLPERLQYISASMFKNCKQLKEITVPTTVGNTETDGATIIAVGNEAFMNCDVLDNVSFTPVESGEAKTLSFGKEVFVGCPLLKTLDLPSRAGAFTAGKNDLFAFYDGNSFNVTFTSYGDDKLSKAAGVTDINILGTDGDFVSKDGIVYTKGYETVLFCPYRKEGEVEIDYRAKTFAPSAFRFCKSITKITFEDTPEDVEAVEFTVGSAYPVGVSAGSNADFSKNNLNQTSTFVFLGCTSLETIVFPARLKSIGDYAFTNNIWDVANLGNGIKYVSFDDGCALTEIGKYAFDSSVLNSISLPAGLTNLGEGVFNNCKNLTYIKLSESMDINTLESLIANIPTLSTIEIPDENSNFKLQDGIIYDSGMTAILYVLPSAAIENYVVPDTVTRIASRAFSKAKNIKNILVEASEAGAVDLDIAESAFEDSGISTISLSGRVKSLGEAAFRNCASLTSVSFVDWTSQTCTDFPDRLFSGCTRLNNVVIPANVQTFGASVFYNCTGMERITFDENSALTSIGFKAFYNCTSLLEIELPANVNSFGFTEANEAKLKQVIAQNSMSSASLTFYNCTSLKTVKLSDNIKYIGHYAFANCRMLESINLPLQMKIMGSHTFLNCEKLKTITFNGGAAAKPAWEYVGQSVFESCASLESITFPKSVKELAGFTASGCKKLATITFNSGVKLGSNCFTGLSSLVTVTFNQDDDDTTETTMSSSVFENCSNLKNLTLSKGVKSISMYAFRGCTSLTEVTIPENVTYIGSYAFASCTALTTVNYNAVFDNSVEGAKATGYIGAGAFNGCTNLKNFNFKEDENGNIVKNINLIRIEASLSDVTFGNCKSLTDFVVPDTVEYIGVTVGTTSIYHYPLFTGSGIKSLTLSKNLKMIGGSLFKGYTSLETVDFNGNTVMTEIGSSAFDGCTNLQSVELPISLAKIGTYAFRGCTNLQSASFEGDTSKKAEKLVLDGYAFQNCENITSVDFSDVNITSIGIWAFAGSGITQIKLPSTVETIGNYAFKETALTEITLPASLKSIGISAFEGCSDLETAALPANLETIGANAFSGTKLTSVSMPANEKLKSIGDGAFKNCANLTTLDLNNVENIGASAFEGCVALAGSSQTTGTLDLSKVKTIGANAFYGCTSLENIKVDVLESANAGAFANTGTALKFITSEALTLENGVFCTTGNEKTAVMYVGSEETVNIPSGVVKIAANMFKDNLGITSVVLPETCLTIETQAFMGCTNLRNVNLENVVTVKASAFKNCTNLSSLNKALEPAAEIDTLNNLNELGASAFEASGVVNIAMPKVTSIGEKAFYKCMSLNTININSTTVTCTFAGNTVFSESSLVTIDMSAVGTVSDKFSAVFTKCASLKNVKLGKLKVIPSGFFKDCTKLETVDLAGVEDIRQTAFQGCTSLGSVEFKGKAEAPVIIGVNAFAGCAGTDEKGNKTGIKKLTLTGVKTIGDTAFSGCSELAEIDFGCKDDGTGSTIKGIGAEAFKDCTALTTVIIPNSLNEWGLGSTATSIATTATNAKKVKGVFNGCTGLESVTFTGGVKYLGTETFKGCTSLKTVDLTGITAVGNCYLSSKVYKYDGSATFQGCTSLTTIDLKDVIFICSNAFSGCDSLNDVTADSVQTVGSNAFMGCVVLTELDLPSLICTSTVTSGLNSGIFQGCVSLESFTFPSGVTKLGGSSGLANMFKGCTGLTSVKFEGIITNSVFGTSFFEGCTSLETFEVPAGITSISATMFSGCSKLREVTFQNIANITNKTFGKQAFLDCSSLKLISIPANTETIDAEAFKGCTSLKTVTFEGQNVKTIKNNAFEFCSSLESIDLSLQALNGNLTTYKKADFEKYGILAQAFKDCTLLSEVKVGKIATIASDAFENCAFTADNITYTASTNILVEDGVVYDMSTKTLVKYNGAAESFKVKDGIKIIGFEAFKGNTTLKSIDFNEVTQLTESAFEDCTALESVDITGITTVDVGYAKYIFKGCTSLKEVYMQGNISAWGTSGGNYMFENCTALTTVNYTSSPTEVKEGMFKGCTALKEFDFSNVTKLGKQSFAFTGLTEVIAPKLTGLASSGGYTFEGCTSLTKAEFAGFTSSFGNGDFAFKDCTALESFSVPNMAGSNAKVPKNLFQNCTSLTSVKLGRIAGFNDYSFDGCTSLTGASLVYSPYYATSFTVGASAFHGCTKLDSFGFDGVTSIGNNAFEGTAITEVVANNSNMKSTLGNYAFKDCKLLESVTMNVFAGSAGANYNIGTFSGCTALTKVDMPVLKGVGNEMFDGCSALKTLTASSEVTFLGSNAFRGCSALKEVTFNKVTNKSYIKGDAFNGWTVDQSITLGGIAFETLNAADQELWTECCQATVTWKS